MPSKKIQNSKPMKKIERKDSAPAVPPIPIVNPGNVYSDMLVELFQEATKKSCSGKVMYDHQRNEVYMKIQSFLVARGLIDEEFIVRKIDG